MIPAQHIIQKIPVRGEESINYIVQVLLGEEESAACFTYS